MKNLYIILLGCCLLFPGYAREYDVIKNYIHISKNEGISNNHVKIVAEDRYGCLWIGTGSGLDIYDSKRLQSVEKYAGHNITALFNTGQEMLIATADFIEAYNYESGLTIRVKDGTYDIGYILSILARGDDIILLSTEKIYQYKDQKLSLIKSEVPFTTLHIDKFGVLWGHASDVVYKLDDSFHIINSYQLVSDDFSPLTGLCLYPDSKGSVWVGTVKDGLYRYNRVWDTFQKEDLVKEFGIREFESIGSIMEDKYDRLWIGYGSGLAVYDHNNRHLQPYRFENSHNITLNTSVVKVFKTSDQHMVIGTVFTGLFYIKELETGINFLHLSDPQSKTGGVTINGIATDEKGDIWVATNCMGVVCLDSQGRIKKQFGQERLGVADILSLSFDQDGNLWAGALSNGLYKITPAGHISHYINQPDKENTLSGRTVFGVYPLSKDSLFIASNKGIDLYNSRTSSFENILPAKAQDYAFCRILPDGLNLWFVNYNSVYCFNRQTHIIREYYFDVFRNLYIESAYLTSAGELVAGTTRGELYYLKEDKLVLWRDTERFQGISGMEEDADGNLWLTSGNRLIRLQANGEMNSINLAWSLGENDFTTRSFCKDKKGIIYFGTSDGLLVFDPRSIPLSAQDNPVMYLSGFRLFNEPVAPSEEGILKKNINYTDQIVLNHNQNFISFGVTLIDYETDSPPSYKCRYRLEKFDDNWYQINPVSNEISFTGLTTGQYTLQIRLEGEDGGLLASKDIAIIVKPHPLLAWYMQFIYALLFMGGVWLIVQFVNRQRRSRELIRQARQEQEELTRMNTMKLEFFTYITHEFKTPLAIISTLQEEILPYTNEQDSEAEIFKRNVKRLEFLVNQLMEFRNMESQYASLDIHKYDTIHFLKGIYEAFTPLYKQKQIDSEFIADTENCFMLFDADKMEMLVGNLLSNSFKHTLPGGKTSLHVYLRDEYLVVDVFNTGLILSEEEKAVIFQPYIRTHSSNSYMNSGIGLAIVQSISNLLDIKLSVHAVENEGNIFRAEIPIITDDNLQTTSPDTRTEIVERIVDNTMYYDEQHYVGSEDADNKQMFQILLVENDRDTRKILKKKLQELYHVLVAANGKEALLLMKSQHVDIVVSDIRMGEMDGFELCRYIKENSQTNHIPVLLITSDLSTESKIQGFRSGADAFLQKPINIQELKLRLDNILRNKHVLRSYYANFNQLEVEEKEVNNADEIFLREFTTYIYEHLNDVNLSVIQLSQAMNMSRTQLYLMVKRLADQTPSAFVLSIKMKRARKLLLTTDMTSSEISYQLGYCNPNHFSRQFKEYFHESPTEFRKSNKQPKEEG